MFGWLPLHASRDNKVMHGWSILPYTGADTYLYLANKLGSACITDEEELQIQMDLRSILSLEQGTLVAVGSGRSSLKYKIHACAHSVKLTSRSWSRACEQMTRTCTWVGDLGETGVSQVKTNLRKLMGEWVMNADIDADAAVGNGAFDIVDEDFADRCFVICAARIWIGGWMAGWHAWMDGWTDGWTDGPFRLCRVVG